MSRSRASAVAAFAACMASAVVVAAAACIPDLPPDAPEQSGPACGDGYIDRAAGEQCDPGASIGSALGGCGPDCRMQCPSGFVWPKNDHCYQLATAGAAGLQEATRSCSALDAHVVTFASEAELAAITAFFRVPDLDSGAGPFWVGLDNAFARYNSVAAFEPGWSPTCSGCFARTLAPGAPLPRFDAAIDGAPLPEGCVEGFSDPQGPSWAQYPCTNAPARISVLCEREPVGARAKACDGSLCIDLAWTYGQKRYLYQESAASADSAEQGCVALGGSLVVLQSQDEREQLWRELSHLAVVPNAIWIGLSRVAASGPTTARWIWDDEAAADSYPSPWGDRQPRASGPLTTTRAFLLHQGSPPSLDDTLAHNDVAEAALPFVCQF